MGKRIPIEGCSMFNPFKVFLREVMIFIYLSVNAIWITFYDSTTPPTADFNRMYILVTNFFFHLRKRQTKCVKKNHRFDLSSLVSEVKVNHLNILQAHTHTRRIACFSFSLPDEWMDGTEKWNLKFRDDANKEKISSNKTFNSL